MKIVLLDHELYRMGLRLILTGLPGYEVVGEAGTERDALNVVDAAAPDFVIMDTVLPGLRGAEGVEAILGRAPPGARILILTDDRSITGAAAAMTAGAAGYALKGDRIAEICRAIDQVRAGRIYVAPALTSRLLARLGSRGRSDQPAPYVG